MFTNLYVKLAIGAVVFALITGTALEIQHLKDKTNVLQTQNNLLQVANKSLADNIEALKIQQQQVVHELTAAQAANEAANQHMQLLQQQQLDPKKQQQLSNVRQKNPQALVDLINRNSECIKAHFTEVGQCVNGQWQPAH